MTGLTRREFGSLLAAAPLAAASRMGEQPGSPPGEPAKDGGRVKARPFPLRQVRLLSGTCYTLQDRNRAYLHTLESDRLLHTFRVNSELKDTGIFRPVHRWSFSGGVRITGL